MIDKLEISHITTKTVFVVASLHLWLFTGIGWNSTQRLVWSFRLILTLKCYENVYYVILLSRGTGKNTKVFKKWFDITGNDEWLDVLR